MRVTVIPADRTVIVDGDARKVCKRVAFPKGVTAIQWYGKGGEIEFDRDDEGHRPENKKITDFTSYQGFVIEHAKAKKRDEDARAEVKAKREAALKKMEDAEKELVEAEKLNDQALRVMDEGDD
jgi:hypothetical protein